MGLDEINESEVPSENATDVEENAELVEPDDEDDDGAFIPDEDEDEESVSQESDVSEKDSDEEIKKRRKERPYTCQECGYAAAKPALLIQHLRSHSEKKPFACPVSGCSCTYKRHDHLNRHMKVHEGTRFSCSRPGCGQSFTMMSNLTRHLKRHEEKSNFPRVKSSEEKTHSCPNAGCDKTFRYPSQLRTHEETAHGFVYAELICIYPGCGEKLPSETALVKHAVQAHPFLLCEVCGETISRKRYRKHVRTHGAKKPVKVTCPFEGCTHHYTRESNLRYHIRSVHLKLKPFVCTYDGCGKSYAHKAARKRHELSSAHVHSGIDFETAEEHRRWKPKGGRKIVCFEKVDDLYVKVKRRRETADVDIKNQANVDPEQQTCQTKKEKAVVDTEELANVVQDERTFYSK